MLEKAQQTDAAEDELHGPENSGDELPEQLRRREQRLEKIRAAKQALEAEQAEKDKQKGRHRGDGKLAAGKRPPGGRSKFKREFGEPEPQAQRNFSDPESRIMKSKQSFEQCYNAQAVVEEGNQLIVAQEVGQNAADNGSLAPLLDQVKKNTGCKPRRVLADAGYKGEKNCQALEKRKIRGFVAQGRESQQGEAPADSAGPASRRMVKRLKEQRGKRQYRRRKGMVEPAFGWVKQVLGFRQFSLRGLKKVQGEWSLVTLALNLRRMASMEAAAVPV